jgi:hypothetical protein
MGKKERAKVGKKEERNKVPALTKLVVSVSA